MIRWIKKYWPQVALVTGLFAASGALGSWGLLVTLACLAALVLGVRAVDISGITDLEK